MSRVRVGSDVAVRVIADSYTSTLALVCAGIRDRMAGRISPAAHATSVLNGPQSRAVARIVHPSGSLSPDCLTPTSIADRPDPLAEIDRLRSMSSAELHADLESTFDGRLPPHWEQVGVAPRRWAGDTADAVHAMWTHIEPLWRQQDRQRGLETDRIGAAAARGAIDIVLGGVHPRGRIDHGVLEFPDGAPVDTDGTGRPLVLALLLADLDVCVSNVDRPDVLWFSHPVREAAVEDAAGLDSLLTPMRARLLGLLDRERSMSELATALSAAPPTMTYQIAMLAEVGLVARRRAGRRILVSRTSRGSSLLDLYGVGRAGSPGTRTSTGRGSRSAPAAPSGPPANRPGWAVVP